MTDQESINSKVKRSARTKRFSSALLLCAGLFGVSMAAPAPAAAAVTPIITIGGDWAAGVLEEVLDDELEGSPDIRLRSGTPVRITGSGSDLKVKVLLGYKKAAVWWDVEIKATVSPYCVPGTSGALGISMWNFEINFDAAALASVIPGGRIVLNKLLTQTEAKMEKALASEIKGVFLKPAGVVPVCPGITVSTSGATNGDLTLDYRAGTMCKSGTKQTVACPPGRTGTIVKTCENGRWFSLNTCEIAAGGGGGPIGSNGGVGEVP